jgi:hypothetical protein
MSAWTKIEHIEAASAQAEIEFLSIPQIYDDLLVVFSTRNTGSNTALGIRFNDSSSTIYTYKILYGNGSTAASYSETIAAGYNTYFNAYTVASGATASTFGNAYMYIPNYRSSTNKSCSIDAIGENNATSAYQSIVGGLWSSTAAISSIQIFSDPGGSSSNLAQYSSATLYGILKGSSGGVTVS